MIISSPFSIHKPTSNSSSCDIAVAHRANFRRVGLGSPCASKRGYQIGGSVCVHQCGAETDIKAPWCTRMEARLFTVHVRRLWRTLKQLTERGMPSLHSMHAWTFTDLTVYSEHVLRAGGRASPALDPSIDSLETRCAAYFGFLSGVRGASDIHTGNVRAVAIKDKPTLARKCFLLFFLLEKCGKSSSRVTSWQGGAATAASGDARAPRTSRPLHET